MRVHRFGGPEQLSLEQTPIPEPQSGEVLVRVLAAGVGPWDALVRSGQSGVEQSLPLTPGSDIAGIVERLPADAGGASVTAGEAVYGVTNDRFTGGYAEYAVASLGSIARKPDTLNFIEAASAPVVAVTAWQMLFDRACVSAGQTVLVLGAGGNVGRYAVQLAHWAGARVIEVSRPSDAPRLAGLGGVVDAVIDTVGHDTQDASFSTLRRGGILVSSVSAPSEERASHYGVRTAFFIVRISTEDLTRIARLFDAGTLKTNVGVVLDLREARKAHEMLAGSMPHPPGKIVLEVR